MRQLAGALNEMLARLGAQSAATERALEATRRFAADAGHELRTPLTALRAQLDTLARNPELPLDQREALVADMTAEQDRMVHLLEGLQALARGEAAESLPREPVELGDVLDAAVHGARKRHPGVRYELAGRVDEGTVDGWEGGLRLLVDNLLDNAALHGRPAAAASAVGLERDDGQLVIRVEDDGPGIPRRRARAAARAVRPRRGRARPTAPASGLAIVAQQAALHGGELRLARLEPRRARRRGPAAVLARPYHRRRCHLRPRSRHAAARRWCGPTAPAAATPAPAAGRRSSSRPAARRRSSSTAASRTRPTTAWSTPPRSRACARCRPASNACVVTDSPLMLDSMTKWITGWKRKGWKTAAGKPVKNQDLVLALEAEIGRHAQVRWHWVRGHETGAAHAHKALNDRADQLAVAASHAAA